jgi:hypothetical protein
MGAPDWISDAFSGDTPRLVVASAAVQVLLYVVSTASSPALLQAKKRAYVLCVYSAGYSTVSALVYLPHLFREGLDLDYYMADDALSRFSTIHFATYLALDLAVGSFHYPQYLGLFTSWIHHVAYILLLCYALSEKVTLLFMVALPLEFPTLVLALGSVCPGLRSDYFFGASFFAFRILYHCYTLGALLQNSAPSWMWQICTVALVPHILWFYNWTRKYLLVPGAKKE